MHAEARLRPVIGSTGELDEWAAYRARGGNGNAALHVDTGMNRLGITFAEAQELAADPGLVERLGLTLVMSHLACADTPAHPLNARQLATMQNVRALFPGLPVSLANTAGIVLGPDYHFDIARPGIGIYGGPYIDGIAPPISFAAVRCRRNWSEHDRHITRKIRAETGARLRRSHEFSQIGRASCRERVL